MATITPASEADIDQIVELLDEMDHFYGDPAVETPTQRATNIRTFLSSSPRTQVLLAHVDERVVGLAAVSLLWPAIGTSTSLYLKELYVRQAYRGSGVGRELMAHIEQLARHYQCSRIEFTTDTENSAAQAFYHTLGYEPHPTKIFYRRQV